MDLASIKNKSIDFISKYRYAILVLLVGIVLMNLPQGKKKETDPKPDIPEETISEQTLQHELEAILSKIEGAGNVKVLLTIGEGETTFYQENCDISSSENSNSNHMTTVTVTNGDRNETGLIRQIMPEKYRGAIVVCQGAEKPSVKLAITEAVSKVTGLSTDHICVTKMK